MNHYITASEADLSPEEKLFTANVRQFAPRRTITGSILNAIRFGMQGLGAIGIVGFVIYLASYSGGWA